MKITSKLEKLIAFATYLKDIQTPRTSFVHWKIIYIPQMHNKHMDSFVRSVQKQSSFIYRVIILNCRFLIKTVYVDVQKKSNNILFAFDLTVHLHLI